jgi:heme/copper-type cytochrome/quinol oxidase subunit 3
MEIPYTVTARPDTGLYNAKVGIWLFLASEVMLFGGLFSSYVFLRIGADFPWPFHELKVLPGFINTMVLIISSVSVVSAWAALKARRYGWFQVNMIITLLCALGFMGIKSFEYYGKFTHYSVIMQDGTVLDGHPGHASDVHHGDKIALGEVKSFSVKLDKSTSKFMKHRRNGDDPSKPYAAVPDDSVVKVRTPSGKEAEFTESWLKTQKRDYRALENVRTELATLQARVDAPKAKVEAMKAAVTSAYPVPYDAAKAAGLLEQHEELKKNSAEKITALNGRIDALVKANPDAAAATLNLQVVGSPLTFLVNERDFGKYNANEIIFRDDVVLTGKVKGDSIPLNADLLDLRQVKDIEKSLAWKYYPDLKDDFMSHKNKVTEEFVKAKPEHANDYEKNADWQRTALRVSLEDLAPAPEAHALMHDESKAVDIERSDKRFYSNFSPSRSPYYAIYFLMTGLHGLHVIGGAIVLGYFLLTGRKMYKRNPEHLANRVEVGGLFWHFVDLVWIFLFPVFYLL